MPELPEVETIKNVLAHNLMGKTVKEICLFYKPLLEVDSLFDVSILKDQTFTMFERRGKYLIFGFSNGLYWIVHLRMEGKFHLYETPTLKNKHTHLTLIADGTHVHYLDTRKFSRMAITDNLNAYFEKKNLGLEPFDAKLTVSYLREKLKNRRIAIKALLLDQSVITGIGNIYADEILFLSRIHPLTTSNTLSDKDLNRIIENTVIVLNQAIEAGGTTIRSYTSSLGVSGRFQLVLNAYGRYQEPCVNCETLLSKTKIAGRTSVYCEKCQRVRK